MIETQRHRGTEIDNTLTYKIIGAAMEVHRTLGGPGLLEGIYEAALCHELSLQGLRAKVASACRSTLQRCYSPRSSYSGYFG